MCVRALAVCDEAYNPHCVPGADRASVRAPDHGPFCQAWGGCSVAGPRVVAPAPTEGIRAQIYDLFRQFETYDKGRAASHAAMLRSVRAHQNKHLPCSRRRPCRCGGVRECPA